MLGLWLLIDWFCNYTYESDRIFVLDAYRKYQASYSDPSSNVPIWLYWSIEKRNFLHFHMNNAHLVHTLYCLWLAGIYSNVKENDNNAMDTHTYQSCMNTHIKIAALWRKSTILTNFFENSFFRGFWIDCYCVVYLIHLAFRSIRHFHQSNPCSRSHCFLIDITLPFFRMFKNYFCRKNEPVMNKQEQKLHKTWGRFIIFSSSLKFYFLILRA